MNRIYHTSTKEAINHLRFKLRHLVLGTNMDIVYDLSGDQVYFNRDAAINPHKGAPLVTIYHKLTDSMRLHAPETPLRNLNYTLYIYQEVACLEDIRETKGEDEVGKMLRKGWRMDNEDSFWMYRIYTNKASEEKFANDFRATINLCVTCSVRPRQSEDKLKCDWCDKGVKGIYEEKMNECEDCLILAEYKDGPCRKHYLTKGDK